MKVNMRNGKSFDLIRKRKKQQQQQQIDSLNHTFDRFSFVLETEKKESNRTDFVDRTSKTGEPLKFSHT